MLDVDLVVACTNRKSAEVPPALQFRSLPRGQVADVAFAWLDRVTQVRSCQTAERLYQGPGWASILRAKALPNEVRLHVISAGLGILRANDRIPAYSATFAEHPDQVALGVAVMGSRPEAHRAWWGTINKVRVGTSTPLTERLGNAERVVLACGVDYLEAVRDDLELLAARLGADRLLIVSTGARARPLPPTIARCLLPGGVDLQLLGNVPRSRLNYFGAEWVLRTATSHGWDPAALGRQLEDEIARRKEAGATLPKSGTKQTDDEVKEWIRTALAASPTATGLHRRFRNEGRACEEKRFRMLAEQVRAEYAGVG